MSAKLIIKDKDGKVVLDLSSRITRFTIDYVATTDPTKLLPKQVIKIGNKVDRGSFWFLTRYAKTAWSNRPEIEGGPYPSFAVYMCDKAEVQSSGFSAGWVNDVSSKMDDNSLYIVIEDTRNSVQGGYQNSVSVDVGRY
ncbi:hypothetical protein vB_AbaM_Acibel004_124 [Acinetobacter phage vB_AbaM_Acibel004]|uniref:hypothetical protein n=1 Tax=Acinetobacter phage vB_AbaM_Acibel004 TaxID=1481186 RepID=UPI0004E85B69|nr:hypothetical protein vB_AbaM_Acibel004_124 [Acinetobacter phage vB_AbaM_Acibel004]AHY26739.1 hypothetical protein vB_AbaM_Acibel004_124 [Acinetobacter phage vB_AbaM_Acibel004]